MTLHPRLQALIDWLGRHKNWLTLALMLLVLGIAWAALSRILSELTLDQVLRALGAITHQQLLACVLLTAASYVVLTGYDVLALRAIGKPQPYWRAALGSFTSYTFSHNLGFAPVTGAATRWRAYRGTGIDGSDIARIVVIAGVTFWLGIILLLGAALVAQPGALRIHAYAMPYGLQAMLGTGILALIGIYLLLCARRAAPLDILGWTLPVPTLCQALIQFALAAVDITVASAALLVLVPQAEIGHLPIFLTAYVVAITVALLTHSPGGLGVFEAVMLVTLPQVDKATLVSALIVYRLIYYLLPLGLSILLMLLNEAMHLVSRRTAIRSANIQADPRT